MIAVESPIVSPSSCSTGNVFWAPRVSHSAQAMWTPGGGARRSYSTSLKASAQRAFSL